MVETLELADILQVQHLDYRQAKNDADKTHQKQANTHIPAPAPPVQFMFNPDHHRPQPPYPKARKAASISKAPKCRNR